MSDSKDGAPVDRTAPESSPPVFRVRLVGVPIPTLAVVCTPALAAVLIAALDGPDVALTVIGFGISLALGLGVFLVPHHVTEVAEDGRLTVWRRKLPWRLEQLHSIAAGEVERLEVQRRPSAIVVILTDGTRIDLPIRWLERHGRGPGLPRFARRAAERLARPLGVPVAAAPGAP